MDEDALGMDRTRWGSASLGAFGPSASTERGIGWHVTLRLADGRGIAREPRALRIAARVLLAQGEPRGLLAFRVADTHTHVLLACHRAAAGRFAQAAAIALRLKLRIPVSFEAYRATPITDERHLKNALRYLFLQEEHHGTAFDLGHDGSSLPDLLGMRVLGGSGMVERVRRLLPRLPRSALVEWLRAGNFEAADAHHEMLDDAACAAFALVDLRGQRPDQRRARHAAAHVAHGLSTSVSAIAKALGVVERSVRRLLATEVDPAHARAVLLQLRLRTVLRRNAQRGFE